MTKLPDGWSLERVRERARCDAELLSCDRRVAVDVSGQAIRALTALCILSFGGQCLVLSVGEPEWYMGQLAEDGSILCWGSYGTELGDAIDAL